MTENTISVQVLLRSAVGVEGPVTLQLNKDRTQAFLNAYLNGEAKDLAVQLEGSVMILPRDNIAGIHAASILAPGATRPEAQADTVDAVDSGE